MTGRIQVQKLMKIAEIKDFYFYNLASQAHVPFAISTFSVFSVYFFPSTVKFS